MKRIMIAAMVAMFAILSTVNVTHASTLKTITITRSNAIWDNSAGYLAYTYNDRTQYGYYECNDATMIDTGVYPVFDLIVRGGSVISLHFTTDSDVTCMIESDDNGTLNTAYITYDTYSDSYMRDSAALDGYNAVSMMDRYENNNARYITYKVTAYSTDLAYIASFDSVTDLSPDYPIVTPLYSVALPITVR